MNVITLAEIEKKIYLIRGQKVMLDRDLAKLYEVPTKRLKEQVKRNITRFPADFMFEPTSSELADLRSQFATANDLTYWNHIQTNPYLFTENGVAMLSTVLGSERAIQINISIIRVFTKLRSFLSLESDLRNDLSEFKKDTNKLFKTVFERMDDIEETIAPKLDPKRKKIGLKNQ